MKKNDILKTAQKTFYKVGFKLKKHKPEICEAVGIIGMVVGTVMACKATLKVPEKTEEFHENLDLARDAEENRGRAVTHAYILYGVDLFKIYWPSLIVGGASIGSICYSGHMYRDRNASLAAAYAAINTGFAEYRERVAEQFGEDVEKRLRIGATEKTVKEKETLEDGSKKTIKKKINVIDPEAVNGVPYSRVFDEHNPLFTEDNQYNLWFLVSKQEEFDGKLERKGYLALNDVLVGLGYKPIKEGQTIGWVRDSENGQNHVTFGLDETWYTDVADFRDGFKQSIVLTFNVTGNILDALI